jgi:membrane-associated phospholipid phosphatase
LLAAAALVTAGAGLLAGFAFEPAVLVLIVNVLALLALAGHLSARTLWPRLSALLATMAWIVATATIMSHASYVFAAANLPLCDGVLARIDAVIGIDVPQLARATGESEWLSFASAFVYSKTAYQLFFAYFVLIATQQYARLADTLSILLLGMTATLVLSALFPAVGAFVHHHVADADLGHLEGIRAGVWHLDHFLALRDGTMRAFPTTQWEGLVTFPSFHTIYALAGAYALANSRWLALPASLFSGAVIFSTVPVGGHHFIDVVAGLLIFAACVSLVEARRKRAQPLSAALPAGPASSRGAGAAPAPAGP